MANPRPREHNSDSSGVADLPEGWAEAPLGTLTRPSPLKTEPSQRLKVSYLGLEHIESGSGRIISAGTSAEVKSTKAVFKAGDILYGKLRPYLNKVAIPDFDGICSTDILVFPAREGVQNNYLRYVLSARGFVAYANHRSSGIQLPRVNFEAIGGYPVPLPPLAEQRRIVANIEALLERVDAAREKLSSIPSILRRFRQSVLAAACSGRFTAKWRQTHAVQSAKDAIAKGASRNATVRRGVRDAVGKPEDLVATSLPDTWAIDSVGALLLKGVLVDLKDGNHGSNHPKASEFSKSGLPFITAAQVRNFEIDYDGAPKVDGEALVRLRVGFADPGDVIFTHKGTVGRVALNRRKCILTPQTTYYRVNPDLLDQHYLVYFLASLQFFSQCSRIMAQTTRDFVPISEQYGLFVFLPPIEEQREIVQRVDALFKFADAIEKRFESATAGAKKLAQSILAKAFRGELVPTEAELARRECREYESAAELLARIRASGAQYGPIKRERRGRASAAVLS
jgi:type I restriction enzyme S subunit